VKDALVKRYFDLTGKLPPTSAEGKFDLDAAQKEIVPIVEAARKYATAKNLTATQEAFVNFFEKQGRPELAVNPDGSMKSDRDLAAAAEALRKNPAPKELTALQQLEERKSLDAADGLLERMRSAQKTMSKDNVVGPVVGSPVNPAPYLGAVFGGGDTRNAQRELTMLVNELTAERTQALKGALSEKELRFLQQTVPKLSDDEAVWNKFLSERIPLLEKATQAGRSALEGGNQTPGELFQQSVDKQPLAEAKRHNLTPEQYESLPVVNQSADAARLPKGSLFRFADGVIGRVP
jgi:hypothetical protein